jgi:phosphate transport system permease protein
MLATSRKRINNLYDLSFKYFGLVATFFGLVMLGIFILNIFFEGSERINWKFISSYPSRIPENAGILSAIFGSIWIMILTAVLAIPIGIASGIFLEEYSKNKFWGWLIEMNISNLAAVPSIIYGLLGLQVFGYLLGFGGSIIAGSATLALLILPIVIVSTREAIKSVPSSLREVSYALGATRWQTMWNAVLPAGMSGIFTGIILSLSRAIGEAAPLIVVGALAYVPFIPTGPSSEYTVLPIQIFNWISRPQKGFLINASAAIIVLLAVSFILNGIAVYLRIKHEKKMNG